MKILRYMMIACLTMFVQPSFMEAKQYFRVKNSVEIDAHNYSFTGSPSISVHINTSPTTHGTNTTSSSNRNECLIHLSVCGKKGKTCCHNTEIWCCSVGYQCGNDPELNSCDPMATNTTSSSPIQSSETSLPNGHRHHHQRHRRHRHHRRHHHQNGQ